MDDMDDMEDATWNKELVSGQNLVVWNGEDGADPSAGATDGVTVHLGLQRRCWHLGRLLRQCGGRSGRQHPHIAHHTATPTGSSSSNLSATNPVPVPASSGGGGTGKVPGVSQTDRQRSKTE